MRKKSLVRPPSLVVKRKLVFIGVPVVSACLTFIFLYLFIPTPVTAPVLPITVPVELRPVEPVIVVNLPVRLEIPSIALNAIIKPVGLTSAGDMAIDDSIVDVAWYQFGPKPGEKGSAVIAGHYGWKAGQPSIFNDISKLVAGDKISTYDEAGTTQVFIVRAVKSYDPQADATEVFKSTDGKAHLNLVTCEGVWINRTDSYSRRLVVFTELE